MKIDLTGKTALVTGASRGIGEAIARRLAAEGATILAGARTVAALERVVSDIESKGGRARAHALDVADAASIDAVIKSAMEEHGQIDVLVNNAGIAEDNLILRMSREAWDRVIATNLTGAFLLTQAVVKGMVRRRYGRIVNVTSVVGLMGNAGQANYAAAKAGLVGLTVPWRGTRVPQHHVQRGRAGIHLDREDGPDGERRARRPLVPDSAPETGGARGRRGAVAFLAAEEAGYVTGTVLNVSGGLYM